MTQRYDPLFSLVETSPDLATLTKIQQHFQENIPWENLDSVFKKGISLKM